MTAPLVEASFFYHVCTSKQGKEKSGSIVALVLGYVIIIQYKQRFRVTSEKESNIFGKILCFCRFLSVAQIDWYASKEKKNCTNLKIWLVISNLQDFVVISR